MYNGNDAVVTVQATGKAQSAEARGSLVWNYDEVWLYNLRDQKELVWNVQGLDDRRARQRARNWEVGA